MPEKPPSPSPLCGSQSWLQPLFKRLKCAEFSVADALSQSGPTLTKINQRYTPGALSQGRLLSKRVQVIIGAYVVPYPDGAVPTAEEEKFA